MEIIHDKHTMYLMWWLVKVGCALRTFILKRGTCFSALSENVYEKWHNDFLHRNKTIRNVLNCSDIV